MPFEPAAPPSGNSFSILAEYIGRELRRLGRAVVTYDDFERNSLTVGRETSASYTVVPTDEVIAVSLSAVSVVCHLPPVTQYPGRRLFLKKLDAGAQTVSFDANGSETIDGAATVSLSVRYSTLQIVAGASEWHILSRL